MAKTRGYLKKISQLWTREPRSPLLPITEKDLPENGNNETTAVQNPQKLWFNRPKDLASEVLICIYKIGIYSGIYVHFKDVIDLADHSSLNVTKSGFAFAYASALLVSIFGALRYGIRLWNLRELKRLHRQIEIPHPLLILPIAIWASSILVFGFGVKINHDYPGVAVFLLMLIGYKRLGMITTMSTVMLLNYYLFLGCQAHNSKSRKGVKPEPKKTNEETGINFSQFLHKEDGQDKDKNDVETKHNKEEDMSDDRINKCLEELKDLMAVAPDSEKADVLEMTVKHLQKLRHYNILEPNPLVTPGNPLVTPGNTRQHLVTAPAKAPLKAGTKKPLNAFRIYMKEMRPKIVAEHPSLGSGEIYQILGRRWHGLSREEQATYYEKERKERRLHMQKCLQKCPYCDLMLLRYNLEQHMEVHEKMIREDAAAPPYHGDCTSNDDTGS